MLVVVLARLAVIGTVIAPIVTHDLSPIGVLLFGWIGQFLKGHPKFPNAAAQGIMIGIGLTLYFLGHGYDSASPNYVGDALAWAMAVPGFASITSTAKLAPATAGR